MRQGKVKNIKKTNTAIMEGGATLSGSVSVQGSKNAALPILSSLPLLPEVELYNVPELSDIDVMIEILEYLGGECHFEKGVLRFKNHKSINKNIGVDFSNKMRASSLFLGPLMAKYGSSTVGMPGGCLIGSRPLDIHLEGFESLGATVDLTDGNITVKSDGLEGEYTLPFPSVGASQNLISASVVGTGTVILNNIAIEPEVMEHINFLNSAGAKIKILNSKSVRIKGVKRLKRTSFTIQSDRIEAFTLLVAALATKGSVKVVNCNPYHLNMPLQVLRKMGADIRVGKNHISAAYKKPLKGFNVTTGVYPGFPTDCQQQLSVLMLTAKSSSMIIENIFSNRLNHLDELVKMGADVKINNNVAVINPSILSGAQVNSFDLRGSASMLIAGLSSSGITIVNGLEYLHRGYENIVDKLNYLGANISFK